MTATFKGAQHEHPRWTINTAAAGRLAGMGDTYRARPAGGRGSCRNHMDWSAAVNDVIRMDSKGRVTIGNLIRKRSVQPAEHYRVTFGEYGKIVLEPVKILVEGVEA